MQHACNFCFWNRARFNYCNWLSHQICKVKDFAWLEYTTDSIKTWDGVRNNVENRGMCVQVLFLKQRPHVTKRTSAALGQKGQSPQKEDIVRSSMHLLPVFNSICTFCSFLHFCFARYICRFVRFLAGCLIEKSLQFYLYNCPHHIIITIILVIRAIVWSVWVEWSWW